LYSSLLSRSPSLFSRVHTCRAEREGKTVLQQMSSSQVRVFWSLRIVLSCAAFHTWHPCGCQSSRQAKRPLHIMPPYLLVCVRFLSIPEQVDRANRGVASKLQGQSPARTVNGTRLNYMYHCRPVPMSSFSEQPCCGLCSVVLLISHV